MTGVELRILRHRNKLSRKQLADLVATSWRTVEGWEQGRFPIPPAKEKLIRSVIKNRR
jgi:DNA-binding transcriptional regulator YiaG